MLEMEADDNTELLKVLEQSRNLLNLVGEAPLKPAWVHLSSLRSASEVIFRREEQGGRREGKEGNGGGEKGSLSLNQGQLGDGDGGHPSTSSSPS